MGPDIAGACTARFVPVGTRFATIEYLPNIGYTNDDASELTSIRQIVQALNAQEAKTVLVNIVPGRDMERFVGCVDGLVGCTTRAHIERLHAALLQLATEYRLPSIGVDYDNMTQRHLFGADKMHLNQEGHTRVAERVLELYETWPWHERPPVQQQGELASQVHVRCYLGEQLGEIVSSHGHGFKSVNFARDPKERTDKIGWEATESGSSMTLCARFPLDASPPPPLPPPMPLRARAPAGAHKHMAPRAGSSHVYEMAVGLQMSHTRNLPLIGHATLGCSGACTCECVWSHHGSFNESCVFDGLSHGLITVTAFARLFVNRTVPPALSADAPCPEADQCALTISNGADESQRHRVIARALIFGLANHHSTSWFNSYHMDQSKLSFVRAR